MRTPALFIAGLLAGACLAASDTASDTAIDRESLRDLDGVRVAVEDLPAPALGLTKDGLLGVVEGKLRSAGIRVLNAGEFPVGDPALRVRVTASPESGGLLAFSVELDFAQVVFLRRNPAVTFNRARTWAAASRMGIAAPARVAESVHRGLAAQVDQFIAAYFAVNHK